MGNEMTYSGGLGGLIPLSPALNANAAALTPLEGARLASGMTKFLQS
jgi:hypothetical protein